MRKISKPRRRKRVTRRPKYALRIKVEGPGVHRKSIAVPDLLKICDALQSAVHRQAEAMQEPSASTLRRGPITASAHEECTLELIGISGGSTGLTFALSKPQQPLPIPGAMTFGADVLAKVAQTVKELGGDKHASADIDAGVLNSLMKLGEVVDRQAISRVSLMVPRHDGRARAIKAVLDATVKARIFKRIKTPTEQHLSIEGKLEMADFKEIGRACRIHPPIGQPLQCSFDPDREEEIYSALRKPVRLSGVARLNPNTGKPEELRIEKVEIMDELLLGERDFFMSRTLEQLAEAQGVRPLDNPGEMVGGWPENEDLDEFIAETYQSRG
jgi:hypothetical protein